MGRSQPGQLKIPAPEKSVGEFPSIGLNELILAHRGGAVTEDDQPRKEVGGFSPASGGRTADRVDRRGQCE